MGKRLRRRKSGLADYQHSQTAAKPRRYFLRLMPQIYYLTNSAALGKSEVFHSLLEPGQIPFIVNFGRSFYDMRYCFFFTPKSLHRSISSPESPFPSDTWCRPNGSQPLGTRLYTDWSQWRQLVVDSHKLLLVTSEQQTANSGYRRQSASLNMINLKQWTHIHQRTASTWRMCTAISPGQWHPWTAVSPL